MYVVYARIAVDTPDGTCVYNLTQARCVRCVKYHATHEHTLVPCVVCVACVAIENGLQRGKGVLDQ